MTEFAYQYASQADLEEMLAREPKAMAWCFRGRIKTVRIGNVFHKAAFANPSELENLRAEFARVGGKGIPSSWGDVFHRLFRSPRVHGGIRHLLAGRVSAGWQEARRHGDLSGEWHVYDIVSAYRWSAGRDLPLLKSGYPSQRASPSGIYLVSFKEARAPHPPNLRTTGALVTAAEIERYDLHGLEIDRGMCFRKSVSLERDLDFIGKNFIHHKRIWRSFWGAWISSAPVSCQVWRAGKMMKSWECTRPFYNPAWAQEITSRVRLRIAEHAADAAHVFVDSVMVRQRLRTGTGPGDWAHVRSVKSPVIFGAGRYGSRELGGRMTMIKQSGLKRVISTLIGGV